MDASAVVHLRRAKDHVDRAYAEPLDVAALARVAHCSPAHFSRRFKEAYGETPHQYVLTRRIERAQELLPLDITLGHRDQFVSGQRYKKPTGSIRWALT